MWSKLIYLFYDTRIFFASIPCCLSIFLHRLPPYEDEDSPIPRFCLADDHKPGAGSGRFPPAPFRPKSAFLFFPFSNIHGGRIIIPFGAPIGVGPVIRLLLLVDHTSLMVPRPCRPEPILCDPTRRLAFSIPPRWKGSSLARFFFPWDQSLLSDPYLISHCATDTSLINTFFR